MVNADGDFVIAKPDKAAWELYQEKAKASAAAAAEAAAAEYSKELQTRGLECPIDKRMFLEPTKTPCCQRTYCNDCISNALIESDFVCPGCATEGVLLDNLSVDEEAISKIKTYEAERAESKKEKEKQQAQQEANSVDKEVENGTKDMNTEAAPSSPTPASEPSSEQPKKRPAEDQDDSVEPESSDANPSAKKQKTDESTISTEQQPPRNKDFPTTTTASTTTPAAPFNQQMPFGGFNFMQGPGIPGMPFPNDGMGFMNPMAGFPGNMDMAWNPMNPMNPINTMNFNPLQNGMFGDNANNGFMPPNMYNGNGPPSMPMFPVNQMPGSTQQNQGFQQGPGMGNFMNQQRTSFSTPFSREEDTPYFRQPVNPQRNQARHRRIRPSDYREL